MKHKLNINKIFDTAVKNQQKKNFEVAINQYNEILNVEPDHFSSLLNLSVLLMEIKNFDVDFIYHIVDF